jgi:hypothetical protein
MSSTALSVSKHSQRDTEREQSLGLCFAKMADCEKSA